jgi:antagonist of KipI
MEVNVLKGGLLTTVQDLGRKGHRASGVPLSGPMDPFAFRIANLLVGNPDDAAALEITLLGPELEFSADARIALCGATFSGLPSWRPLIARAGERVRFGECLKGSRAYLAMGGGIAVPAVLGSRSTHLPAGIGGFEGRALRDGDRLELYPDPLGPVSRAPPPAFYVSSSLLPRYSAAADVRVVKGAQAGEFGTGLFEGVFEATSRSDRMGLRLKGNPIVRNSGSELASAAAAPGTIQVPPDGQPIILMADAQSIGGYAQAAHVVSVDRPLVAQLRPQDRLQFREVSHDEAQHLLLTRERELAILREGVRQRLQLRP